jgi:N-acetyl-anhydromuramyl-L-alanine amidase AmpD
MRDLSRFSRSGIAAGLAVAALTLAGGATALASPVTPSAKHQAGPGGVTGGPPGGLMAEFTAAAKQFRVPLSLLLAVGYNESRWEWHGSSPSADGGYGIMDLTAPSFTAVSGRDGRLRTVRLARTRHTLSDAARLLHVSQAGLKTSTALNVRGAAADLARYAREVNGGKLPGTLGGWYGAVAAYSGDTTTRAAAMFANEVYSTIRSGAALVTSARQAMRLPADHGVQAQTGMITRLGLNPGPASSSSTPVDCPAVLHCRYIPAAYALDPPQPDPYNYGDYDKAHRPKDLKIYSIVIHDTEESYANTIATFTNPASYVSANYVIKSSNGAVTEMVRPHNVAWAVGNWYYNTHSVSIENEGFAAQGATWYTNAMYRSDALLVRYLAHRYGVPLNREHIIGHDNVGGPSNSGNAAMHWDPGPFWNWNYFMSLVLGTTQSGYQASLGTAGVDGHHVVSVSPHFARNQPTITDCQSGSCVTLPKQPANFVYLHTKPSASSPLLSDPTLHPDGSPGTREDSDWSDKAPSGEQYVLAGRSGNWTGIWFGGQVGWFYNPPGRKSTARFTGGWVVTPKPGLTSVPVYGSAFPEASAYPADVPVQANPPLAYSFPAGQAYVTIGLVPDDYYHAVTFDNSAPDDHTVIRGTTQYYEIVYNHRLYYVKAAGVRLEHVK